MHEGKTVSLVLAGSIFTNIPPCMLVTYHIMPPSILGSKKKDFLYFICYIWWWC